MDQLNVVSLAQAKMWLRVDLDYDYEDGLITALIKSAVNQVEKYTLQVLWQRTITEITDKSGSLKIYNYPVISVEDVVDKDVVAVDFEIEESQWYTSVITNQPGFNKVTYVAGYDWGYDGGSEVPDDIETAIKEMITYLYENRDNPKEEMPKVVQYLLAPYRRITLF
jgi:uncharacterized phiE125 gp8 family phage protein